MFTSSPRVSARRATPRRWRSSSGAATFAGRGGTCTRVTRRTGELEELAAIGVGRRGNLRQGVPDRRRDVIQ